MGNHFIPGIFRVKGYLVAGFVRTKLSEWRRIGCRALSFGAPGNQPWPGVAIEQSLALLRRKQGSVRMPWCSAAVYERFTEGFKTPDSDSGGENSWTIGAQRRGGGGWDYAASLPKAGAAVAAFTPFSFSFACRGHRGKKPSQTTVRPTDTRHRSLALPRPVRSRRRTNEYGNEGRHAPCEHLPRHRSPPRQYLPKCRMKCATFVVITAVEGAVWWFWCGGVFVFFFFFCGFFFFFFGLVSRNLHGTLFARHRCNTGLRDDLMPMSNRP